MVPKLAYVCITIDKKNDEQKVILFQVFWPGEPKPVFFVASRGHHADIGGITPGSMPPHSKCIQEEGAVFKSFKLVDQGKFQEEGIVNWIHTNS